MPFDLSIHNRNIFGATKAMSRLSTRTWVIAGVLLLSGKLFALGPTPAEVVRSFYAWYIQESIAGAKPLERERPEIRKFVTDRLLLRIDSARKSSPNRDPFLNAEQIDPTWARNVAVGNIFVGRIARLSVALTGLRFGDRQMELKLVQENGTWKIDEISFD